MKRPLVVYWNNLPAPYMIDRWNAVARRGNLDLEVWLSARADSARSWNVDESTWEFPFQYLPSISVLHHRAAVPTQVLHTRADVMISLYAGPAYLVATAIGQRRGMKTGFWVEPTSDAWTKRYRWKESLKKWVFPRMDGLITTGPTGRSFCRRYGADDAHIFEAQYGVDVDYFAAASRAKRSQREEVRNRLGVHGTTFIYVGRFWHGKGLDTLLDAFTVLQRHHLDVSLLLVGDGEDESRLRKRCEDDAIGNVIFHSFMQRDVLPEAYVASDVFVFPTLGDPYGLVVDEAMATGLPIISSSAAGEIDVRVKNGVNGFVVPPSNSAELLSRMEWIASNTERIPEMGKQSQLMIASNTPDRFAQNFENAVFQMLTNDGRI